MNAFSDVPRPMAFRCWGNFPVIFAVAAPSPAWGRYPSSRAIYGASDYEVRSWVRQPLDARGKLRYEIHLLLGFWAKAPRPFQELPRRGVHRFLSNLSANPPRFTVRGLASLPCVYPRFLSINCMASFLQSMLRTLSP